MNENMHRFLIYLEEKSMWQRGLLMLLVVIWCIGCNRMSPGAINRPYEYDMRMWGQFSSVKALIMTSSDTLAVPASGMFSAENEEYSLSYHIYSPVLGGRFQLVKNESGTYCQSGFSTLLFPEQGEKWTFESQPWMYTPFAFDMRISVANSTVSFKWFPETALKSFHVGDWVIDAFDAPLIYDPPLPVTADLRGDGIERMYSIDAGGIYERSYENGKATLSKIVPLNGAIPSPFLMTGRCHEDGRLRLYSFEQQTGAIMENEYAGAGWQSTAIVTFPKPAIVPGPQGRPMMPPAESIPFWCFTCVDPRGEGKSSIYYGTGVCLYEARWVGGVWEHFVVDSIPYNAVYLSSGYPRIINVACGDVRDDGISRLYYVAQYLDASSRFALVECEHDSGSIWHSQMIIPDLEPQTGFSSEIPLAVLPARDGKDVLLVGLPSSTCEVALDQGQWIKKEIIPSHVSGIAWGKGRNDGIDRVYFTVYGLFSQERQSGSDRYNYQALPGDEIREYTCNGVVWTQIASIPGVAARKGLIIGKSKADGIERIYAMGDLLMYEISYGK